MQLILTKSNILLKFNIFWTGIIISFVLMTYPSYYFYLSYKTILLLKIVAFFIFILCNLISIGFEISHPFFWFNVPFFLYSISAPLLYFFDIYKYYFTYQKVLDLEYLAILFFSLIVGPYTKSYKRLKFSNFNSLILGNKFFILLFIFLAIIYLGSLIFSGVHSKYDKVIMYSPFFNLDFVYYLLNVSISIYFIKNLIIKKRLPLNSTLFFIAFLILSFLLSGERDIIFRFIIVLFLIVHLLYKKIERKYLVFFFIVGIFLLSILNDLKMALLAIEKPNINVELTLNSIIFYILGTEFRTASGNLAILIQDIPGNIPYFMGKTIVWDLKRAIIPGFLFPRESFISTGDWYNKTFFPHVWDIGGGVGFTMVGLGYINFGIIGVISLFIIIGLIIRKIYNLSSKSVWWFIFYVNLIPILIYSIRTDISAPLSQSVKHIIFPLVLIQMFGDFYKRIFK